MFLDSQTYQEKIIVESYVLSHAKDYEPSRQPSV
jgi:hypothetical protein